MREGEGRGSTYLPDAAQTVHKRQATETIFSTFVPRRATHISSLRLSFCKIYESLSPPMSFYLALISVASHSFRLTYRWLSRS